MMLLLGGFAWQQCSDEEEPAPVDCSKNPVMLSMVTVEDSNCGATDGRIEVRATGGSGSYQYSLNGGTAQNGAVFSNLAAGVYTVTAMDENECTGELEVPVSNLNGLNISFETEASGCGATNGVITIDAFDGEPPYHFSINNGAATESNTFSNLQRGTYDLVVSDATGCEVAQEVKVTSGVSFAGAISPIIQAKCAVSGCHNGTQFPDFRVFKNVHDNAGQIKTLTGNRTMPQEGSLTQNEIDLIACWVDDGALDN